MNLRFGYEPGLRSYCAFSLKVCVVGSCDEGRVGGGQEGNRLMEKRSNRNKSLIKDTPLPRFLLADNQSVVQYIFANQKYIVLFFMFLAHDFFISRK